MKADGRILSAARNAKGCPFQGSSRVPQPWQDLKGSRALKTRLFGDRGFESFFLLRRVTCEPDFLDQAVHWESPRDHRYPTAPAVRGCAGTVISSATLGSTLGSIDCAWARRNPARGAHA